MPKCRTIQIVWHGKEPVYSLDFHPDGTLATAGADKEIKLWKVSKDEEGYPLVEHCGTLTGHSKTVNCVRCSPSGNHIVSGGDGGELLLWSPQDEGAHGNLLSVEEAEAGWKRTAAFRGHTDDVMDLAWSSDGTALLSGSIDNKGIIWDVSGKRKGSMISHFANHKHFVQGVAWDPHQQFVLTQSADRTCKIYALRPPPASKKKKEKTKSPACVAAKDFYCLHTMSKRIVTGKPEEGSLQRQALFADESVPSFFRRPAWSPDGSFFIVPAGVFKPQANSIELNTAYLYARGKWAAPVAHLPSQPKSVVAASFCPTLFENDPDASPPKPFELMPYKMVYAIATLDSVVIYDTTSSLPLAAFCQIHFDSITDIRWSPDGSFLAISSRDCFCSIIAFEHGELGMKIDLTSLPTHIQTVLSSHPRHPETIKKGNAEDIFRKDDSIQNMALQSNGKPASNSSEKSKKVRRITPVPVQSEMENGNSLLKISPQREGKNSTSTEETSNKKKKRITPVPVIDGQISRDEAPFQVESPQTGMDANGPASHSKPGGIAMLAAAAGKNAALGKQ